MNKTTKKERPSFKTIINDTVVPTLIIPSAVVNEIRYLNTKSPSKEWSGILFYTINKGSINDAKNLVLEAKGILLKDIGTAGSTAYEFSADVVEYMDRKAKELNVEPIEIYSTWKIAHHHSHCSMGVTPSGTDTEEIEDNIKNHVMYLTTITNNSLDISAWLSVFVKVESKSVFSYTDHELQTHSLSNNTESDGIMKYMVKVEMENTNNVSDEFKNQYEEVVKANTKSSSLPNSWYSTGRSLSLFDEKEQDFKAVKQNLFDNAIGDDEIDFDIMMLIDLIMYDDLHINPESVKTVKQALNLVDRRLLTPYQRQKYLEGLEAHVIEFVANSSVIEMTFEDFSIQIKDMMDLLEEVGGSLAKSIQQRLRNKLKIQVI